MKKDEMRKKSLITTVAIVIMGFYSVSFAGNSNLRLLKKDTLSFVTYSGRVIDAESNKPVVFANVYLHGTSLGTVTNSDGEFILKVPKGNTADKLAITFIGYTNLLVPLNDLKTKNSTISMERSPIPIEEVVVRSGDAYQLIKSALLRIKDNYNSSPEMQLGFYRETIKQNRNYVEVAEAVLDVYKSSYIDDFDFDRVKIYKGRKSEDVKKMDTVLFKFQGGPKTSFLLDVVKIPGNIFSGDILDYYTFKLVGLTKINDKESYIIEFDQKSYVDYPLYQGRVYLDVKNLAIAGIDFKISEKGIDGAASQLIRKKPFNMKMDVVSGNYLVNYRELNGKWYLNYVRSELVFKCKWDKKLFRSTYTTTFEMAVTDRDIENVSKFKYRESAKMSDVFADQADYFADEDFWGEYNFIKPDESIESAIEKLNRKLKIKNLGYNAE